MMENEQKAREVLGPGVLHVTCDKRFVWHDDALRAMQQYAAGLQGENARLREALMKLDDVLDFDEPGSEDKPWIMDDWTELNEAFDLARTALGDTQ